MFKIEEIAKQHVKLFPLADLLGQISKICEELREYKLAETDEHRKKELADCLIVCAGIYRFDQAKGKRQMQQITDIINMRGYDLAEVEDLANRKWLINLNRTWKYENGYYHHLGKDGSE